MNWKNFFLTCAFLTIALAFMGYIIYTAYVVPVYASCDSIGKYYDGSQINLSLAEWMFGNMIASLIVFFLMLLMGKENKQEECAMRFLLVVIQLYILFEIVWSIIGFMVFNDSYKEACSLAESFNTLINVELYYGIILFPVIVILSIILAVLILKEEKKNQDAVLHQQSDLIAPLNEPAPAPRHSNVYRRIAQRISASFQQNPNSIN